MSILETIVLAIVEGLTEFLPISSTGHMMIAQKIMMVPSDDFTKAFIVCIQLGAILSVVVLYWKRFFQSLEFYYKLIVAFIPAALLGFLLSNKIDELLENVLNVGIALFIGGIIFLFIEKLIRVRSMREPTYGGAFVIGFFQCIAMIPGVSRSAATVIGGLTQGLNKKAAAEFSFFLAVPTMLGATVFKLKDAYEEVPDFFNSENLKLLAIGNGVAFLVGLLAIRTFVSLLTKYGLKPFGYYRIALGAVIIALYFGGVSLSL